MPPPPNRASPCSGRANDAHLERANGSPPMPRGPLRPVEVAILVRYRDALSGRVLSRFRAGRLTGYLGGHRQSVTASICRRDGRLCPAGYPKATYAQGDLRDLTSIARVVGWRRGRLQRHRYPRHSGRPRCSTHLRAAVTGRRPGDVVAQPRDREPARIRSVSAGRSPRETFWTLVYLPRGLRQPAQLVARQRDEAGLPILNDGAHGFSALHYYITRTRSNASSRRTASSSSNAWTSTWEGRGPPARSPKPELHYVARGWLSEQRAGAPPGSVWSSSQPDMRTAVSQSYDRKTWRSAMCWARPRTSRTAAGRPGELRPDQIPLHLEQGTRSRAESRRRPEVAAGRRRRSRRPRTPAPRASR